MRIFDEVAVEIPAVPEHRERLEGMVLELDALERTKTLSVYYCSCGTQELIASRGLARRRRPPRPGA